MELLEQVVNTLDDMKAIDRINLDVKKLTAITDTMIIVTGNTPRHTRSMADALLKMAAEQALDKPQVEGEEDGQWILVNLGDVICHIMVPETRHYYALEKLWG